jgi:hypothetical protein
MLVKTLKIKASQILEKYRDELDGRKLRKYDRILEIKKPQSKTLKDMITEIQDELEYNNFKKELKATVHKKKPKEDLTNLKSSLRKLIDENGDKLKKSNTKRYEAILGRNARKTTIEKAINEIRSVMNREFEKEVNLFNNIEVEPREEKRKVEIKLAERVWHDAIKKFTIDIEEPIHTIDEFFKQYDKNVKSIIKKLLDKKDALKIRYTFWINFKKNTLDGDIYNTFSFSTTTERVHKLHDLEEIHEEIIGKLNEKIDNFVHLGSGWILNNFEKCFLTLLKYRPLKGKSYIELCDFLKNKKALINIKNEDNQCFKWCIYAGLYPIKDHAERVSNYQKIEKDLLEKNEALKFDGIDFPVEVDKISKFEKMNNIAINVFQFDETKIPKSKTKGKKEIQSNPFYNIQASRLTKPKTEINLLFIDDKKNENTHYVLIKDLSRLLCRGTEHRTRYYCPNCFHSFTREDLLIEHKPLCYSHETTKAILPEAEDAFIKFSNYQKTMKKPFAIYADFESILIPTEDENNSKTHNYQTHKACSYAYVVVSEYEEHNGKFVLYRAKDEKDNVGDHFCKAILEEGKRLRKILQYNNKMIITEEQKEEFKNATICHICKKELKKTDERDRDHDHYTGLYRGAAHHICNELYTQKLADIPIFFHNLKGYDAHLIMQSIGKFTQELNAIATTEEKYISFSVGNQKTGKLVFLDSCAFMADSLENLAKYLGKENMDKFILTKKLFPNLDETKLKLLTQKGVYPYDYLSSIKKFDETVLPSIECFDNKLNKEECPKKDYSHAQNIWNIFEIKNLGEYHDIYLKTDVLLLADIFEEFRKVCQKHYGLDACNYCTAPGLAWDASIKKYNKPIELMNNKQYDMYLTIEKGIRGGQSFIANRHYKANNKYMKNYNPKKPSKNILYLDCNNLYGWSMIQKLPVGDFKQENIKEWNMKKIQAIKADGERGLFLEVDLEYPKELHNLHNDYPLAVESITVNDNMLSEYQMKLKQNLKINECKVPKLCGNLMNKTKYLVHYRNLQLYLSLGMKCTKIHQIISFEQDYILRDYVMYNTKCRAESKNEFEKNFFKLMNNSVFGKTMENVRKHKRLDLCTTEEEQIKCQSKFNFDGDPIIFNENLIGNFMKKTTVTLNKPIHIGFAVLELSKLIMYDFYYNTMKKKYGNKMKLLFTDTDSLCLGIETEDLFEDLKEIKSELDTSNYPENHPLYNKGNKAVVGKFKDEAGSKIITEFVGLRSKLYSYQIQDDIEDHKRCKGVKKSCVKHELSHNDYKDVLLNEKQKKCSFNILQSKKHIIHSVNIKDKIALSCFDDKRYLYNYKDSLAFGHYKIPK